MMFPSTSFIFMRYFLFFLLLIISKSICIEPTSIVIEIKGDCEHLGKQIAHEHGYRYVRQIFRGFCEFEEDPTSNNHYRHRRAIEDGIDPATILANHKHVEWAESQIPKVRQKREFVFNDPLWYEMWYLVRNSQSPSLPDLNVTGAWKMGYTGRGQVVTFLDDGLEFDHPDLQENYDKDASTDINNNDDDPSPRYDPTDENKHGTRCAGEVAAKINNNVCGVGIAYHARVGGIRMLDGDVTDSVEARSLSFRPDHIDIYSASWGPDDNGLVVDGPGRLAKKAFEEGALHGRDGKGSIFVWASGNGGRHSDSCACDGYITSIYTIAISATTEHGEKPWYLEECSATLATAYSSGQGNAGERDILTTDLHHKCTTHHTGTSAAAPLAAAIYALVLEANHDLTWRDIMHITVLGSRPYAIPSNTNLVRNAAGFNVSSRFGFGLMDAGLMTWYASGWKNVPPMSTCTSITSNPKRTILPRSQQIFSINFLECNNDADPTNEVNYIEQVQVFVTLLTERRGEIEIYLFSPSNTRTQLLPRRERDQSNKGFQDWPFLTVQLWGEVPHGEWKLQIINTGLGSATLQSWRLVAHGTREYPISPRSNTPSAAIEIDRSSCHIECKPDETCGNTDTSCTACRHLKQVLSDNKFRCVGICPEGTYLSNEDKLCLPCHPQCGSCRNATETSCISCKSNYFLIPNTMTCVDSCPEQYFTDRQLRKCIRCKSNCASCDTSSHICTSCFDDYAIKDIECIKSTKPCKPSEYFDFTKDDCRWCDSRCSECSGPQSDQCKSCDTTSKYPYLQYHSCVSACSTGFYLVNDSFQCVPCHDTCLKCTSSSESSCTSCKIGYVLLPDEHRCEKHTGKPYYLDMNTGESHTCHASCAQCKGPEPNNCIACNTTNQVLLEDGHCVNKCPLGTYKTEKESSEIQTNICLPCLIGCTKCTNQNQCDQCDQERGYKLKGSSCIPLCKHGTFLSNGNCEPCQTPCLTCANLTHCLTCTNDYYLLNNQCVDECPNHYYLNNKICLECHPTCNTCYGPSQNECKTCTIGFQMNTIQRECLNTCPNGNYFDATTNECKMCTNQCSECFSPGSYCRQCVYPMALDTLSHQCLPCCHANKTSPDCCQCSSSWDGYCLHPFVVSSIYETTWFGSSLNSLYNKVSELYDYRQAMLITGFVLFLITILIGLITCALRQMSGTHLSSRSEHENVEYVMLQNVDDDDEIERIPANGVFKEILPTNTIISMDNSDEI